MKVIGYTLVLLLIIFGITFAILNSEMVSIHYYIGAKQLPLSLLLAIDFGVGLLIGWIFMGFMVVRLKTKLYRLKKKLQITEKEVNNLRAISVRDQH